MGYDRSAPQRPVNPNLNADLVEQCRLGVANQSAYVERLLAADLELRQAQANLEKARVDRAIDAFNAFFEEHGTLSDKLRNLR